MRFSANLGFLWADLPLPDAIYAAKAAGFLAVECHWPYMTPPEEIKAALDETNLEMLGLNTIRGDVDAGENGLSALPGREDDARSAIDQAIAYARAIGARAIHVMAGNASGEVAHRTFLDNLRYASTRTPDDITLLIEPLNRNDAPDYFLKTTEQAREIITELALPQLKLMFDCYHIGRTEGDLITRFHKLRDIIGHIQFAAVPDRGAPDHGEIDYQYVFDSFAAAGWRNPLGAEYKPVGETSETLGWMRSFTGES